MAEPADADLQTVTRDYECELDAIINSITQRVWWHLRKLETLEKRNDVRSIGKMLYALGKLATVLINFLKIRGVKFDAGRGESLAELLSRLRQDLKKAEEVIRNAA